MFQFNLKRKKEDLVSKTKKNDNAAKLKFEN